MATSDLSTLLMTPELKGLERQRLMAQALLKQGLQTNQGQMIGNRYVPVNPLENIGNLSQVYMGNKKLEDIDQQELALAKALREKKLAETTDIMQSLSGTPEIATELAGPAYQGVTPQAVMPAVAANPQEALAKALKSETGAGNLLLPSIIENVIPKKTQEIINYETAKKDGFKGTFNDYKNQMNEYQKEELKIQKQRLALEGANQNKPQIVETANGFVAVNPRNPAEATPVSINGQPLMGSKGALTGEPAKQVAGAKNLNDSIANYQQKLQSFNGVDMVNPNARADMQQAYNTMMLQAKEAFNLGVLNGKDWEILQSVVKDPTSPSALLLTKNTLNKQSEELKKTADKAIKNAYEISQKPLPTNMQSTQMQTSAPSGAPTPGMVQSGYVFLGGDPSQPTSWRKQ